MPGPPDPDVPPEVPEEFAEAYRAAYEQALREQTTGPRHVPTEHHDDAPDDVPDDERWAYELPVRSGPPRESVHRDAGPTAGVPTRAAYERVRDARWVGPMLLALIVVTLLVLAFVVGQLFD